MHTTRIIDIEWKNLRSSMDILSSEKMNVPFDVKRVRMNISGGSIGLYPEILNMISTNNLYMESD